MRIDLTYYTDRLGEKERINKTISSTPGFVLKMEKVILDLNNQEEIEKLRGKLKSCSR